MTNSITQHTHFFAQATPQAFPQAAFETFLDAAFLCDFDFLATAFLAAPFLLPVAAFLPRLAGAPAALATGDFDRLVECFTDVLATFLDFGATNFLSLLYLFVVCEFDKF